MSYEAAICSFCRWYYVCDISLEDLVRKLENVGEIAISHFQCNYMKINNGKCYLLISGNKREQRWVKTGNETIWERNTVHLLGMTIEYDLSLGNICFKSV